MSGAKFKRGVVYKDDNKNIESLADALAEDAKCGCFGAACCPIPHIKLEDASGNGKDYMWNDDGVAVFGTKAEMEAAAVILNA